MREELAACRAELGEARARVGAGEKECGELKVKSLSSHLVLPPLPHHLFTPQAKLKQMGAAHHTEAVELKEAPTL